LENGKEMVEEYNMETNVLVKRAWKEKGKLGQENGWVVEVGDPDRLVENLDTVGIRESSSAVCIIK
jgi:hypothetical protein